MLYYCTIWDDLEEERSTNSKQNQNQEKDNNTKSKIPAGLFPFTPRIEAFKNS